MLEGIIGAVLCLFVAVVAWVIGVRHSHQRGTLTKAEWISSVNRHWVAALGESVEEDFTAADYIEAHRARMWLAVHKQWINALELPVDSVEDARLPEYVRLHIQQVRLAMREEICDQFKAYPDESVMRRIREVPL